MRLLISSVFTLVIALFIYVAYADEQTTHPGKTVFNKWCVHCHSAGAGFAGTQRLAWSYGEDKSVLTQRTDLTVPYVKLMVRNGRGAMPAFRYVEISDEELQALAAYLSRSQ